LAARVAPNALAGVFFCLVFCMVFFVFLCLVFLVSRVYSYLYGYQKKGATIYIRDKENEKDNTNALYTRDKENEKDNTNDKVQKTIQKSRQVKKKVL
jgi:hypothetical protein